MLGDALYYGPLLMAVSLLSVLVIRPTMRLLAARRMRRAVPGRLLAGCLATHLIVLLLLHQVAWSLALAYLLAVNLYLLFAPRLAERRRQQRAAAKVDAAIARLERIAAVNPEIARYHIALADACLEHGRYEEAVIEYQMAIALQPVVNEEERRKLQRALAAREAQRGGYLPR
ncbi:MAG: tetratricopeptide repeat protein [Armatimonadota bacterium]